MLKLLFFLIPSTPELSGKFVYAYINLTSWINFEICCMISGEMQGVFRRYESGWIEYR